MVSDALVDLVSGSAGGVANVLVGQPMDTVKVKLQTFPHLYRGTFQCFTNTWRNEGLFRGLYAGSTPALVANVSENSCLFAARGLTQGLVARLCGVEKVEHLSTLQDGAAGSLASLLPDIVLCPTELVKCKLQAARETGQGGAGAGGIVRGIFREKGFLGFFQGLVPLWCRDVPGYFCFFLSYEGSRSALASWGGRSKDALSAPETMLCGGLAGVCFWTCVFPMDVVKSRIQVRGIQGSVLSIGLNILRHEGAATLYRGLTPALLRIFPSNASLFLAYETTKKYLTQKNLDK